MDQSKGWFFERLKHISQIYFLCFSLSSQKITMFYLSSLKI